MATELLERNISIDTKEKAEKLAKAIKKCEKWNKKHEKEIDETYRIIILKN